jgi:hypothetical protein
VGQDDEGKVYCDIQMPLAQGRELSELVNAIQANRKHRSFFSTYP